MKLLNGGSLDQPYWRLYRLQKAFQIKIKIQQMFKLLSVAALAAVSEAAMTQAQASDPFSRFTDMATSAGAYAPLHQAGDRKPARTQCKLTFKQDLTFPANVRTQGDLLTYVRCKNLEPSTGYNITYYSTVGLKLWDCDVTNANAVHGDTFTSEADGTFNHWLVDNAGEIFTDYGEDGTDGLTTITDTIVLIEQSTGADTETWKVCGKITRKSYRIIERMLSRFHRNATEDT